MRPFVAGLALGALPALAAAQEPAPRLTLDWPALAERIVRQLAPEPGEKVLLVAHPRRFQGLVPHLRYALLEHGAVDLGVVQVLAAPFPEAWHMEVLQRGARPARDSLRTMFRDVDAAVMLPEAGPVHPAYAALQDLLREGRGRTVHFHWAGVFALPGQPLPPPHVVDAVYQSAVLRSDYAAISAAQRRFEAALRAGEVRVTTPRGTDLRFRIGDRPVNLQDGDASAARARRAAILIDREIELPCGAVRVAPLEESVEGTIAYPPSQWDGRPVEGLRLRLARGRVTDVQAASGKDAAEAEMARGGEAARGFREFVLGFNPELAVPDRGPWIPYYGYGAGVVRLSLGDNTELGGRVGGGYVRWDFITDATVGVGGEVWVRSGRLTGR